MINSFDLSVFAAVTAALAAIAFLAHYRSAVRATRADPTIAPTHNAYS
jgi:hypothetical protein